MDFNQAGSFNFVFTLRLPELDHIPVLQLERKENRHHVSPVLIVRKEK